MTLLRTLYGPINGKVQNFFRQMRWMKTSIRLIGRFVSFKDHQNLTRLNKICFTRNTASPLLCSPQNTKCMLTRSSICDVTKGCPDRVFLPSVTICWIFFCSFFFLQTVVNRGRSDATFWRSFGCSTLFCIKNILLLCGTI